MGEGDRARYGQDGSEGATDSHAAGLRPHHATMVVTGAAGVVGPGSCSAMTARLVDCRAWMLSDTMCPPLGW